jgi:hypothetical protein
MVDPRKQAEVEKLLANAKLRWSAVTPDGKEIDWYPAGAYVVGDPDLSAQISTMLESDYTKLRLSHNQYLPNDISNPHSVRLALEIIYNGKGEIKYTGNVPNFEDVAIKISPTAIE